MHELTLKRFVSRMWFVILVLVMSATAQIENATSVRAPSNELAHKLWEATVAAKGGRERLRQITSLYVAANQGDGDRQNVFYIFPGYTFNYSYAAKWEGSGIHVSNVKRGIVWWQNEGNPARPRKYIAEDVYLNLLPQFIYLMITHDIDPVPVRSRKEWIGLRRVDVVETDTNGWRVDYYLDSKTHLPVKVVLPLGPRERDKGEMSQVLTLEDYAEVNGVMMPHTVTHSFTFDSRKWKERLTFEINPKYDPSIFEQPPRPKMGPEAWRFKS
jgi:hypothetical protein